MPERLVERIRNRYVITDELVQRVHEKMQSGPMLGGDIADLIWGAHGNRPLSKSAFHEAERQLSLRYKERYGVELMSTTAYREEKFPGEKAMRRGGTYDPST